MNKNQKPELVFVFPSVLGGVASFNWNLLAYSKVKNQFFTRVILLKDHEDKRPDFPDRFDVDDVKVFLYSSLENQYFVLKRLSEHIGPSEGAVVCDNQLTLKACALFTSSKTIFFLVHDFYYVNLGISHVTTIDVAIAHSRFFSDCIFASNPRLFSKRTFFIPYGVRQYPNMPEKSPCPNLRLFFLGRLDEGKGATELIKIERDLRSRGVEVDWLIIGTGPLSEVVKSNWAGNTHVKFVSPKSTQEVYKIIEQQDIFIFPTEFEGTPVSIMEAMANACVVVCSDLPGGIQDMIRPQHGFKLPIGNISEYGDIIQMLNSNRIKLREMQEAAWKFSLRNFDVFKNVDSYFTIFSEYKIFRREPKLKTAITLSRLDNMFFPNFIVKFLRKNRN